MPVHQPGIPLRHFQQRTLVVILGFFQKFGNGVEDQPRVDFINTHLFSKEAEQHLLTKFHFGAGVFDVIIVSDQAEAGVGAVTPELRNAIAEFAANNPEKVIWVDSRMRPELFRNVIVKPNQKEAEAACMRLFGKVDYERLRRHIGARMLPVTHGQEGVMLVESGRQTWVKTNPNPNPVDICGAGDSFSAGAAMALAVTKSPFESARFGNIVASITVTKKGTGTATPDEVRKADRKMPL